MMRCTISLLFLSILLLSAPVYAEEGKKPRDIHEAVGHGPSTPRDLPSISKRAEDLRKEVHETTTKEGKERVMSEVNSLLTSLRNVCGTKNHSEKHPADHERCTATEHTLVEARRHAQQMP